MNDARALGAERRRWVGLAVLLIAAFMDLLNGSIVNVAIPSIRNDLGASYAAIQWIIAGYTLACAVTLITGGRLGDIFGRKRMFLVGTAGFTVASALCALAQSPEMLVGARILQGLMAALMLPQVLAIIHLGFGRRELGKVVTLYAFIGGLAMVGGPIIGGLLLDLNPLDLAWRGVFALNLPIGAAALVMAAFLIDESRAPHALRLDPIGVLLVTFALLLLVYPLAQGRELGWPDWSIVSMICSPPLFAVFVLYERRKTRSDGSPLIELGLFAARSYTAGLVLQLLLLWVISAFFFVWTLYLQLGRDWSALHTGLTTIPFSLGASIAGGVSMRLYLRFGRASLIAGVAMMIAGVLVHGWHGPQATSLQLIAPLLLIGVGLGQVIVPLTALTLADVPPQEAGGASGMINAITQLGTVLGIALIGVVFFTAVGQQAARSVDQIIPRIHQELSMAAGLSGPVGDVILADFRACVIGQNTGHDQPGRSAPCSQGFGATRTVDDALSRAAAVVRREAFAQSFQRSLWYVLGTLVLILTLLFALPERAITPAPEA